MRYLISAIMSILLLCGISAGCNYIDLQIEKERVTYTPVIPFLSNEEYKKVLDFHGVKGMVWSREHYDFTFLRDGIWCRAKAFELLRGEK